jgi:hypothetical protein
MNDELKRFEKEQLWHYQVVCWNFSEGTQESNEGSQSG